MLKLKSLVCPMMAVVFLATSCETNKTKGKSITAQPAQQEQAEPFKDNQIKELGSDFFSHGIPFKPVNDQNYNDFKKAKSGLLYKFHRQSNSTEQLTDNDVAIVRINYFLNDSCLMSSALYPKAFKLPVQQPLFAGDLYEGMLMMHVSDSASFVVRADSTFAKLWKQKPPRNLKKSDAIRFDIRVDGKETKGEFADLRYKRMKEQSLKSDNEFQMYLDDHNIVEKPTKMGLVMVEEQIGSGKCPVKGDIVKVIYNATLLNGNSYQSSNGKVVEWKIGSLDKAIPWGLDEGLRMMKKGGRATFYIPYKIAFSTREYNGVPAFSNFIYEVEMVEIRQVQVHPSP